jgi:tRNA (guanine26-N2/guanine27-N2)-dimethyltransferase
MKEVIEGETRLKVHTGLPTKRMPVFYNPVKEFDRTLSVKVVKALRSKKVMDLLAASGARGLRLMKEAGVEVVFNDLNPEAVRLVKKNLKLNGLNAIVHNKEANHLLYELGEYFDFIDLDPFGSPNPYLDSCIKFTARHGVLAVTATDTAALNGAKPKACLRKYHSSVKRHPFMKETGLRVLVKHVIEKGCEHEMALKPILSHYTKHYYRVYFKKDLGAGRCDALLKDIKYIYYCNCGHRGLEPCKHKQCIELGPVYAGKINSLRLDDDFVKGLNKEDGFPPWHYNVTEYRYKQEPKIEAVLKKHKAVRSHYDSKAFKTKKNKQKLFKLV